MAETTFVFPFAVNEAGRLGAVSGEEAIRGKIIQVLFTAPGERVNQPEFGCGLFHLVFEPNNEVLAAAMQFTVGQALMRWLGEEIVVDHVGIQATEAGVVIEVTYTNRQDLSRQGVRIHFR
jgi:uncharacterized protein